MQEIYEEIERIIAEQFSKSREEHRREFAEEFSALASPHKRFILKKLSANLCNERTRRFLIKAAESDNEIIRINACDTIGIYDDDEILELLLRITEHDSSEFVINCALISICSILCTRKESINSSQKNSLRNTAPNVISPCTAAGLIIANYLVGNASTDEIQELFINAKSPTTQLFILNLLHNIVTQNHDQNLHTTILRLKNFTLNPEISSKINDILFAYKHKTKILNSNQTERS